MNNTYSQEYLSRLQEAQSLIYKEPKKALHMMRELFPESAAGSDDAMMADLFYGAGNACFIMADSERGMDYLHAAARIYRMQKNNRMVVKAMSFMGILQLHQGSFAESIESFAEVADIAREINDPTSLFKAYAQLAQTSALIHNQLDAAQYYRKAESVLIDHPEIEDQTESIPIFLSGYAENEAYLKDYVTAEKIMQKFEGYMEKFPRFRGSAFEYWPQYLIASGRNDESAGMFEDLTWQACTDPKRLNAESLIVMTAFIETEFTLGRYERSIELAKIMMSMLEHSDLYRRKMAITRILILSHEALGNDQALHEEVLNYFTYKRQEEKFSSRSLIQYMQIREENHRLMDFARTDELTGIHNRRALNETATEIYESAFHDQHLYAYEMLDVDTFKEINDTYGHAEGDRVLKVIGKVLQDVSEDGIFTARYGGDEFAVVYYNVSRETLESTAKKIREGIAARIAKGECLPITVSQGIFAVVPYPYLKEWMCHANADKALYHSKETRKGEIHIRYGDEEEIAL